MSVLYFFIKFLFPLTALHVCSSSPVLVEECCLLFRKLLFSLFYSWKNWGLERLNIHFQGYIIVQSAEQELKHVSVGSITRRPWCKHFEPRAPAVLSLGTARSWSRGALLRSLRPRRRVLHLIPGVIHLPSSDQWSGYFLFVFKQYIPF